jgi:malonyl-CoA O-methyltransferase
LREVAFPGKREVRRSFDRAASSYDEHAIVQREVDRRLLEHLDPIRIDPARIVDLGCGTGRSLEALARRFPQAQLLGVDIAPAMLARGRARGGWWQRALGKSRPLVCADIERLPLAPASCDFAYSNLALQWCRPQAFFAEAARVLPAGGLLLFSTLGPDTLKELRAAFGAGHHVHGFVDMHDLGDELVHAGFADPVMEMEAITIEYASVDRLARDLKGAGAHNLHPQRARGLCASGAWKAMVDRYESARRSGSLPATCEVVYGHAWKGARKRIADGRQVIDFRPRETA